MYEGKLIRLREHRIEEVATLQRWMNDLGTARKLAGGGRMPYTLENERQWVESHAGPRDTEYHFAIETLDGRLIGGCSYHNLDWRNRHCQVGWYIGDPDMRGQGYGTDMIRVLLKICFTELNLQKVSLMVHEHNTGAVRLYEKLGFVREGAHRREVFAMDRWWDKYSYGMFREEWENSAAYMPEGL